MKLKAGAALESVKLVLLSLMEDTFIKLYRLFILELLQ